MKTILPWIILPGSNFRFVTKKWKSGNSFQKARFDFDGLLFLWEDVLMIGESQQRRRRVFPTQLLCVQSVSKHCDRT